MVYQMVKYQEQLNQTFQALADPTRRALLARLQLADGLSVSDLAQPLPMTLPAVMKHLDVLSDAGLIKRAKAGRTVTCRLSPGPMREAMDWLARYERFWTDNLDRLTDFVEAEQSPEKKED
jgi:DNA-binding transcriptional ArsR family regulator